MKILGLDAGSVSVKAVILDDEGTVHATWYRRHRGNPIGVCSEMARQAYADADRIDYVAITGSAGKIIASCLSMSSINEIVAQSYGTKRFLPEVRTIIEMGGEDSKLIVLDEKGIKDFAMNSVCAAGTGSFLDQQAERLRLGIEEFGRAALVSETPPRIAGRCSVFAKSDMIHLQQIATSVEDIVAGLCFAVVRNFKGSIAKGREITPPVSFQGGVAANPGMRRAFSEVLELDNLIIPEHFAFMGAIGAALKALEEDGLVPFNLEAFNSLSIDLAPEQSSLQSLVRNPDDFKQRHLCRSDSVVPIDTGRKERIPAYMGIDIGSISTNLAVIDEEGNVLAKRYLMTAGRPIEAVLGGLKEISNEVGSAVDIKGVGTTGSGRYMIADFVGADIVKNEITAQATAAAFINPDVDTILEIGGQDSKYISLDNGVIVDFEMNKACAAGTGSFLEEQAEKLNISVKEEFATCAFSSESPCGLGERCTVFMENSLMANLKRGTEKNDLLAGLAYSIVENYTNRVVAGKRIGENIFFQGGVAFNKSVVAAFENFLGKQITVPPHHDVTGAIGMALIARDHVSEQGVTRSRFKGFDIFNRKYSTSSFECKGCPNVCEINRVRIEGEEKQLFYGGRCEKYDINRKKERSVSDLFAFREEILWEEHRRREAAAGERGNKNTERAMIGIPYLFFFHEYLPFWSTLLWELGFNVVVSPGTNRRIVDLGVEVIQSESCFPVKVAHGHIKYLLDSGVEHIFTPSFVDLSLPGAPETGSPCPYTQTIPYLAKAALDTGSLIRPVIDLSRGPRYMVNELFRVLRRFGVSKGEIRRALGEAGKAQDRFEEKKREKGRAVLEGIDKNAIVIIGRAYNAFEKGVNLQIPQKLATLDTLSIPMDFLPLDEVDISDRWTHMYWRNGYRILKAARYIKNNPFLYPIYIGNFSCGPDSFILSFFSEELGEKTFLHIEIDEHSADAGAITRCEAYLDSIRNRRFTETIHVKRVKLQQSVANRKIYIPRMSDHAFALAAAFESCGVEAEVMPVTDNEAIKLGKKHVSGKECYPCAVTTGDMLKKALSSDFDPASSAFFMPSGTGPCRFGQYHIFQRILLDKTGFSHIPIYSPVQSTQFYSDLGIIGGDFTEKSWKGIVATELLIKSLHETRSREKEKGMAEQVYNDFLPQVTEAVKSPNGQMEKILARSRKAFADIPKFNDPLPLIGIVGEIFVRSNAFSNEHVVRKVEALGGTVWLAPFEEWIYYVNNISMKKALRKRDYSAIISLFLKSFFQKRIEHRMAKPYEGSLITLREPETKEILEKGSPYIHETFEGEAILTIGKTIDLIERGASGIINVMPFGCMPGTITTALLQNISRAYNVPCISIAYDGTESTTTYLQLEAFMEQAKIRMKASGGV